MKILVMGLPGAGKSTLARALARRLSAVHFDADDVRKNLNKDLGFSIQDRIEQARRMGWLCDRVVRAGGHAIADFICPTKECRRAFGEAFVIWVDRIKQSRFPDTDAIFEPPDRYDLRIDESFEDEPGMVDEAESVLRLVLEPPHLGATFDPKQPTAFMLGRYQPFHDGHKALYLEAMERAGQVCIAVRDTAGHDGNPFGFEKVRANIVAALPAEALGKTVIIQVPNITKICYGRDVGYTFEKIDLSKEVEAISATAIRRDMGLG